MDNIESNLSQNENVEKNENENKEINSNDNEVSIDIKNNEEKIEQTENIEKNTSEKINETENNKANIIDNKSIIPTDDLKDDKINNLELNENKPSEEQTKEKKENPENDGQIITETNIQIESKKENIPIEKIIEEKEEYTSIENILNENQNKNNILNNNQIYFTEANTLVPKTDIHKSNSNKIYTLTSIPEYSNIKIKKTAETPMKIKSVNYKKNNINICLNNLSPEMYMKKKVKINKETEVNILKNRIKKYEEEIQKQNEYDYKKAMKECKIQYIKDLKNKEKEKQIIEEHKKLEEKLKNMEEYRKNMINNKIKKILQRQKNKLKNKSNLTNSSNNILIEASNNDKIEKINNEKILKTLESYEEKLPILPGMPKYEIIKLIKNREEENFCINTEQRINGLERNHRKNYLKHLYSINHKLAKQNEIYNLRYEKCLLIKDKSEEIEENFMEKDMIKRYNINQNIMRELSEKKEKAKGNYMKNIENVKEKKELLQKQEQQKIKKILKRLNRYKSLDLKKNIINNENINNQRIYFSNLQKENLNKANKEIKDYYNDLILRQEDYLWIVKDLQKDESSIRNIVHKKALETQNKKNNELKYLSKFMEKMDKTNINNQKGGTKMKMFLEQRRAEIESKKREEEEKENNGK